MLEELLGWAGSTLATAANPWLGLVGFLAGASLGKQYDQKWFGPVYGVLNDRHFAGAAPGTPYTLMGGTWRADAAIIAAKPRKRYTHVGPAKYRCFMACVVGRCPDINHGDPVGATIPKWFWQGKTYTNIPTFKDRPAFELDGTQTAAPAGLLYLDPDSGACQGLIGYGWDTTRPLHVFKFNNEAPQQHSALVVCTVSGMTTLEALLNGLAKEAQLMGGAIEPSMYDFSECAPIVVRGWGFTAQMNFADYMAKVCEILDAELYPGVGQQKARPKSAAVADYRVTYDDAGFVVDDSGNPTTSKIRWTVDPKKEVPRAVVVRFTNWDNDHQQGSVTVTRDDSEGQAVETYDATMIAMTADEAEIFGYRWLDEQHKKLMHGEISLGIEFSGVRPGDVLDLDMDPLGARRMLVRVDQIPEMDPLGPSNYLVHRVSDGTYTHTSDGGAGGGGTSSGSTDTAPATAVVQSGVEWDPDDPMAKQAWFAVWATWADDRNPEGVQIWWRKLGETEWTLVTKDGDPYYCAIQNRTPIGSATSALTNGAAALAFEARTVNLLLDQTIDELVSTTDVLISAGYRAGLPNSNGCILVKADGTGETFCFRDAVDHGGASWTISHCLTGLYGTTFTGHLSGERFANYSNGEGVRVTVDPALRGQQVEVLIQEPGGDFSATPYVVTIADPAADAKPADVIAFSGHQYQHSENFRLMQARFTSVDPSAAGLIYQWQRSTDGGMTWMGWDGTVNTYYTTGPTFLDSISSGGSVEWRVRTKAQNGTVSAWLTSTNTAYVPPHLQQLKFPVKVAQTVALPAYTVAAGILTSNTNVALANQDGVALVVGDRVLLLLEGVYSVPMEVVQLGSGAQPWKLQYAADSNQSGDYVCGMRVDVQQGTIYGTKGLKLTSPTGSFVLGTSVPVWTIADGAPNRQSIVGDGATSSWTLTGGTTVRQVLLNGALQTAGLTVGTSYAISGTSLTIKLDNVTHVLATDEVVDVISW